MDHLNPWVDAAEMMRLAEALLASPVVPSPAPVDAGFGGEFIGYEPQPQIHPSAQPTPAIHSLNIPIAVDHSSPAIMRTEERFSEAPIPAPSPHVMKITAPVIPQYPQSVPLPPAQVIPIVPIAPSPAAPIAPPLVTPDSPKPLLERLVHFRAILRQHFAARGVFLLDEDGKAIFDDADHGKLYFMARSLAFSSRSRRDDVGNVHVRVGSTTSLVVIPADTVAGNIVLGLVVDQAIPPEALVHIVNALRSAVSHH